jgi:hypothetical protein
MPPLQKILVTATLAVAIGAACYEARRAAKARAEIEALQLRDTSLTTEIQQMQRQRDDATNRAAALLVEIARLESNPNQAELLRMRGELTRLTAEQKDPSGAVARNWLAKVNQLKQRFEGTPGAKIPELRFLSEADWLELANTRLETEADFRKDMGELRKRGESYFVKKLQAALNNYMRANDGRWPSDVSQLKVYFATSPDDAMLQRWEIVPKATFPNQEFASEQVIVEKSPDDREFDHRWTIDGPFSAGVGPYQHQPSNEEAQQLADNGKIEAARRTLDPALKAYAAAHDGKEPPDPYQLQPYLTTPDQRAALETVIEIIAAKKAREQ